MFKSIQQGMGDAKRLLGRFMGDARRSLRNVANRKDGSRRSPSPRLPAPICTTNNAGLLTPPGAPKHASTRGRGTPTAPTAPLSSASASTAAEHISALEYEQLEEALARSIKEKIAEDKVYEGLEKAEIEVT